jgi:F-type H+-transporting ATPase subunit epsilon
MIRKINCSILTPEKTLYEGSVGFAVVQAHNGELGFLYNHAPLVSELGVGEIRLRDDNRTDYLVIEGGIVEIRGNRMIVLAENAYTKDELNAAEIEKRLKEIKEMQFESFSKEKFIIQIEENKLKARLKVALR